MRYEDKTHFASAGNILFPDTLIIHGKCDNKGKDGSKRFVSDLICCDMYDWCVKLPKLAASLGKNIKLVY